MWNFWVYFAVICSSIIGAVFAISVTILVIQWNRKKQIQSKMGDLELQKLSLSVRTTSDKKVSFEGSQDTLDGQIIIDTSVPRKTLVETYSFEELKKSTDDFNSSNLIEGSVFHGRLNGNNLAIKQTEQATVSIIDFTFFHNTIHHHPNIMRFLGTTSSNGPDSFLVFEYAKNGTLKDWLHGGLAMKSHFIASCHVFLTWNQRLKICFDIAMALQYMHHIMIPSYVHRNVKSRNIFLDEDFNAKIGNFGIPRTLQEDTEESSKSKSNSWSIAYLAPEYLHHGIVSSKIDIFSYGVVLLEILSGKTPITRSDNKGEGSVWLSEKIKTILQSENVGELKEWMDGALGENYWFDEAVTLANIASSCIEENPSLRPSAGEIVGKLEKMVEKVPEVVLGQSLISCESSSKPLVMSAAVFL